MSPASVLSGLRVIFWCLTIFASLVGWGFLIARIFKLRNVSWGLAAGLGLAAQCFGGGLLNQLHLVTPTVLLSLVGAGCVAFLFGLTESLRNRAGVTPWTTRYKLIVLAVVLLASARMMSCVRMERYGDCEQARESVCPRHDCQLPTCNRTGFTALSDDLQAYMIFPVKMLHSHYLPPDPYSQRRVIGSIGFNYYLQDIFLSLGDLRNISVVDGGLGLLLLAFTGLALARVLNLLPGQTLIVVFLAAYTKEIYWNLSFVWLPCGLFLVLALIACDETLSKRPITRAVLFGVVGGAAVALKNNYLIFVVLFIVTFYAARALRPRSQKIAFQPAFIPSVGIAAAAALIVILPWMIQQHNTSGTYFFSILGHGDEYSTYHLLPSRNLTGFGQIAKCFIFATPVLLVAAIIQRFAQASAFKTVVVTVSLASGAATLATGAATGADMLRRYCYPQTMAALLLLFPLVCYELNRSGKRFRFPRLLQGAAIAVFLAGYAADIWNAHTGFNSPAALLKEDTQDVVSGLADAPLNTPSILAEYKAMQGAIPAGGTVIETVTYPYLFDFTRNTIFEASFPAMASPPPAPGWPILSDGETLARWLNSHGIRYLAYSYVDQKLETSGLMENINGSQTSGVVRATAISLLKSHAQYDELALTRKHIYDDGSMYVLDLEQRW